MVITRGDTIPCMFQRKNKEGQPIEDKAPKIYFTVKESNEEEEVVLQKTIDDMEFDENFIYHFTIWPEDTDNLYYGTYKYDIQVKYPEVNYKKTISKGNFIIEDESTWKANEV